MDTMTLHANGDSRILTGEVPPGFESAFKALSVDREDANADDLHEVKFVVTKNADGTFAVTETSRVLVQAFKDFTSTATLQVGDEAHCWV
jgi:hypothetical protein